jgi:hypothetical protein
MQLATFLDAPNTKAGTIHDPAFETLGMPHGWGNEAQQMDKAPGAEVMDPRWYNISPSANGER